MTKTFTENDLLQFIYGELSMRKKAEITQALVTNPALQDQLNDLLTIKQQLENVSYRPSDKSINKIMDFSNGFEMQSK